MRRPLHSSSCFLWLAASLLGGIGAAFLIYTLLGTDETPGGGPLHISLPGISRIFVTRATPPPPTPNLAVAGRKSDFGVHLARIPGNPDPLLDRVLRLGVPWVELDFNWGEWQYFPDSPQDWSGWDRIMASAQARDLRVLIRLHGSPAWSNSAASPSAPPDDFNAYAAFAAALAARYPGVLGGLEVWYHPNRPEQWRTAAGPSPQAYAQLLTQTAQAVHAEQPGVLVISGALAEGPGESDYLSALSASGADCLGVESLGSPEATVQALQRRLEDARRWGQVCLTGLGYPAVLDGKPPSALEWSGQVTEVEQADYLTEALSLLTSGTIPPVQLAVLWNLDYAPASGDPTDPASPYSLLNLAGEPRSAFTRLQALFNP